MSRQLRRAASACGMVFGIGACLGFSHPARAGTLTVVHAFNGTDGATPYKGVTLDSADDLYGETFYGANACADSYEYSGVGCGTAYTIDSTGNFSTLLTFLGQNNGADGFSNITLHTRVYGGAYDGGANDQGLLFSMQTGGTGFKILHVFTGTDGQHPNSFLRFDSDNSFYSVTPSGGPGYNGTDGTGNGVLFKLAPDGTLTPEHDFSGGADGGDPGRIFRDSAGTIYGATLSGGSCTAKGAPANGCGVIYSFVPDTGAFNVLYTFLDKNDGYAPALGGIDAQGNLYGATIYGGTKGYGTLFKIVDTNGVYTHKVLHNFMGPDGQEPIAAPSLTSNDTLVGTTIYGGNGQGVLYTYHSGTFTTLFSFSNDANGGYPESTPVMATNGVIYGTTAYGGTSPCNTSGGTLISSYGCGVVFKYTP